MISLGVLGYLACMKLIIRFSMTEFLVGNLIYCIHQPDIISSIIIDVSWI